MSRRQGTLLPSEPREASLQGAHRYARLAAPHDNHVPVPDSRIIFNPNGKSKINQMVDQAPARHRTVHMRRASSSFRRSQKAHLKTQLAVLAVHMLHQLGLG